jgi:hypothetical protein
LPPPQADNSPATAATAAIRAVALNVLVLKIVAANVFLAMFVPLFFRIFPQPDRTRRPRRPQPPCRARGWPGPTRL